MFRHLVKKKKKNLLPIIIFHSSREKSGRGCAHRLKNTAEWRRSQNWFAPHYFTPFSLVMKCCSVSRGITLTLCVVFSSLVRCVWACADELLLLKYWKSFFEMILNKHSHNEVSSSQLSFRMLSIDRENAIIAWLFNSFFSTGNVIVHLVTACDGVSTRRFSLWRTCAAKKGYFFFWVYVPSCTNI